MVDSWPSGRMAVSLDGSVPAFSGKQIAGAAASNAPPQDILVLGNRPRHGALRMRRQLLACKSIDRLISDSEGKNHRLSKTLGLWSLTALGIGAVIGSGIFVLTGTAAAGEHFETASYLHAQVMDLISNIVRHGSP